MKTQQLLIFLLTILLAACTPGTSAPTETPNLTATSMPLPPTPIPTLQATSTFALATLTPTQLTIVPTLNPTQAAIEEEIKSVIEAYFEIRYQALSVEKPDGFRLESFGDLVSDSPEAKAFQEAELGRLAFERKRKELDQLLFANYEYFLDFENFILDSSSQIAMVSVIEDYDAIFESSVKSNPQDPTITHMSGLEHKIALHKEQGKWKIISDDYTDYLWRWLIKSKLSTDELLLTVQAPTKPVSTSTP